MDDRVFFIAPLFGARCAEAVPLGDVAVSPVTWAYWEGVEKSDVVREQAGQHVAGESLGLPTATEPPPCLVADDRETDGWGYHLGICNAVVIALRLLGATRFVDPAMTVRIRADGSHYVRRVGPYRMSAYSELHDADDDIDADLAADAAEVVLRLLTLGVDEMLDPVRALSAQFLPGSSTVMVAMQLIEGIYGRMDRSIRGLSFVERLAAVGVPHDLVEFMGGPGAPGRQARNDMAHGRDVDPEVAVRVADVARSATLAFVETEVDLDVGDDPVDRFRLAAFG